MARRIYTVHRRHAGIDHDLVLVKDGFSWPAFFFTVLWALWHRLWRFALLILAGAIGISLFSDALGLDPLTDAALGLAWTLLVGFEANDARRRALARRGFVMDDIVYADGLAAAEHRFFAKHHPAPIAS